MPEDLAVTDEPGQLPDDHARLVAALFDRALLAIELGNFSLADRLAAATAVLVGLPGRGTTADEAGQTR
ncbi:hypothetical protein GCM10027073_72380 [Streptomyces chlorus]|uniref:TetR family transcriptional regulator n=1 Tax=Streptomyces chlorus TaxID=887452 RepID=A0ABW1DUV7_9ACTN